MVQYRERSIVLIIVTLLVNKASLAPDIDILIYEYESMTELAAPCSFIPFAPAVKSSLYDLLEQPPVEMRVSADLGSDLS